MYYCFSLSTMVMRTRLNVTFMLTYTLPVLYDFEYWKWRFETRSESLRIAFTTVDRCTSQQEFGANVTMFLGVPC
jgi:hypothetical protein